LERKSVAMSVRRCGGEWHCDELAIAGGTEAIGKQARKVRCSDSSGDDLHTCRHPNCAITQVRGTDGSQLVARSGLLAGAGVG